MHLARTCKKTQAAGRWGLSLDLGAPSGRGGSPGARGLPSIPDVQAPGGSRGGEGTGGSSERRGQRQAQLRGAGSGGEKEEKGEFGGVSGLVFWFAVVGIGAGNSAPKLSPKEGRGDLGWGRWQGKPGTERGR